MSWKATAFVKDMIHGITVAEKMVLFVLADYHHTVNRAAWPSLPTLAEESLMSKRNVQRVLQNLELKGIIRKSQGDGRGHIGSYEFAVLDYEKDDNLSPFLRQKRVTYGRRKDDIKGDNGDIAIRKEPVLELEPVKPAGVLAREAREKQARLEQAKAKGFIQ